MNQYLTWISVSALIALLYGLWLAKQILGQSAGSSQMQEIAKAIQQGARAYLNRQYKTIGLIAIILFIILTFLR